MMRIKKKYFIFAIFVIFFIFVYFYLNNNVPSNSNLLNLENKLKRLQNGFKQHRDHISEKQPPHNQAEISNKDIVNVGDQPNLKSDLLEREEIIESHGSQNNNDEQCSLNLDVIPKVDVQMLKAYRNEIPFDNPDGGVWKQGYNIEYDTHQWNRHHKLKVFVVPHSHNDPGWINTFDEYYERQTKQIFANMLRHLDEHEDMRFIWAEIVYFSKWYESLTSKASKNTIKKLVKERRLEFVTGGWVMPDEACSHWYSILQSLTEGQKWLKNAFNVTPVSSWAIDPFGHSPTSAHILKKAGFENLLIQRTHYSVKKYLSQHQQLEFRWRQGWDGKGDTDLFTHMMPFYSYDVPHTCGPDPKICCQFDFKRLPGYGVTCPWRVNPQPITDDNVAKRAELIIDQWRKKSVLYKTRSVLIPLGDDFRYAQSVEWEAQRSNYEKLFDHINSESRYNVEAKFATLQDYFDSVRREKDTSQFPSLSGDFFTYADRDDHYWSGYFTSKPYYKRMDRVLMNFLRTAEMMLSWNSWDTSSGFETKLEVARRALSLFQHHDGVAGTAKDYVMRDYENTMIEGIKNCKFVMQQAAYRLLTQENIYQPDHTFQYFNIDDSRSAGGNESRSVIIIGEDVPYKYIAIHNSLPKERSEVVEFYVAKPFVSVTDSEGNVINAQVSPSWTWHRIETGDAYFKQVQPQVSTTRYRLMFIATVPPLGMTVYKINAKNNKEDSVGTSFASTTIFTDSHLSVAELKEFPEKIEVSEHREVSLRFDESSVGASFNKFGLLKSFSHESTTVPIHLEFMKYGARSAGEMSGAYIFLPDGPATSMQIGTPIVLMTKGELYQEVATGLPFAVHENIFRKGEALEIRNHVDIGTMRNTEIIMRMSTNIKSEKLFYTDLNGLQIAKRERFSKIPLQANYYPIPSTIFIEDKQWRLTLFTSLPLGGSSLKSGEMEIMQDRRLNQDDNRGLGQGVLDNRPVMNIFKLILESRESCRQIEDDYPNGFLTPNSHEEQKRLLHPLDKFIFNENEWTGVVGQFGDNHDSLETGMEVVTLRSLPAVQMKDMKGKSPIGIVMHRTNFGECATDKGHDGSVNVKRLLGLDDDTAIFNSHITLLSPQQKVENDNMSLCPMDIKGLIISKS